MVSMIRSDSDPMKFTITVDNKDAANEFNGSPALGDVPQNYCSCKTEICQCGSKLGVTEANIKAIFSHLGFPDGRDTMIAEGYRMDALHIWGTHDLSTKDILGWLEEYNPKGVEWIDDSSCNVTLNDENTLLRILNKLSEPFDRRIALAAMAAIVSTMDENEQGDVSKLPESAKALPIVGTTDNLLPPNGRWFKSISSPERAFCLYFRIAHKGDVKLPGAERRSNYYRRYGNPNYGGAVGLLSRSFRRRVKAVTPTTDIRCVNVTNSRELVSYDEIDLDVHGLAMHLQRGSSIVDSDEEVYPPRQQNLAPGQRREAAASGLSNPPRNPPPKWPRRSSSGLSSPDTVFRPPVSQSTLNFDFGRSSAKQRLGTRNSAATSPLATVTILPEDNSGSLRMLTSLRMVADLEEEAARARHCLRSDNIFNQPGPSNRRQTYRRRRFHPRGGSRSGDGVWDRLG
ncbi:hypothetical protein Aperf_G00000071337 [Anoplocephala perfoliata]